MKNIDQINNIFKGMTILTSSPKEGNFNELSDTFKINLGNLEDYLQQNEIVLEELESEVLNLKNIEIDANDIGWNYTLHCLKLLYGLLQSLRTVNDPTYTVSVSQQKQLLSCLEFVIALGLSPNLCNGVGMPMHLRSSFAQLTKVLEKHISVWQKYERLALCTEIVLKCFTNEYISSNVISQYLVDVLAALCQLCFAPLKKPQLTKSILTEDDMSEEKYLKLMTERNAFLVQLDKIMEITYTPSLIHALLKLQSQQITYQIKVPRWMKKSCGSLLTKILLSDNGIFSVIKTLNDSDTDANVPSWKKYEMTAKLISTVPEGYTNESYIQQIIPQLLEVMKRISRQSTTLSMVFSATVYNLYQMNGEIIEKFLLSPLFCELKKISKNEISSDFGTVIMTSEQIDYVISNINCLMSISGETIKYLKVQLKDCIFVLMALFSFANVTKCELKDSIAQILLAFLNSLSVNDQVTMFKDAIIFCAKVLKNFEFLTDDKNMIYVIKRSLEKSVDWILVDQNHVNAVISILSDVKTDKVKSKYFLSLLNKLMEISNDNNVLSEADEKISPEQTLFKIEKDGEAKSQVLRENLVLLNSISELCEKFGASLLTEKPDILKFIIKTLERGAKQVSRTENSIMMESETLSMAMGVLTTVMFDSGKIETKDKLDIMECYHSLEEISLHHFDENIKVMAEELLKAISSMGMAPISKNKSFKKHSSSISIIEDISSNADSEFQTAWNDLSDPLIPVRGHGLVTLTKLINTKDVETMRNKHRLLAVFLENIQNEDSYIYLSAIQGLAALTSCYPDDVVTHLTNEFKKVTKTDDEIRNKMKLGEILVKVSKNLGEIAPKFRDTLMCTFLSELQNDDPHIRASCLSNIGELCKELRFAIGPYLQELLQCLHYALSQSEASIVRRAAVMVISLIFKGCGIDSLKILEKEIKDIYRALKFIYEIDKDEVVKLHSQLALEELNSFMKEIIFSEQKLVKKISILEINR